MTMPFLHSFLSILYHFQLLLYGLFFASLSHLISSQPFLFPWNINLLNVRKMVVMMHTTF